MNYSEIKQIYYVECISADYKAARLTNIFPMPFQSKTEFNIIGCQPMKTFMAAKTQSHTIHTAWSNTVPTTRSHTVATALSHMVLPQAAVERPAVIPQRLIIVDNIPSLHAVKLIIIVSGQNSGSKYWFMGRYLHQECQKNSELGVDSTIWQCASSDILLM